MDDLDRILSSEQEISPSPGFARSVIDEVRREAETPPLAFPWRRLVVGLVPAGLILLGALFLIPSLPAPSIPITTSAMRDLLVKLSAGPAGHLALALLVSLLSIRLSLRLAGHRS